MCATLDREFSRLQELYTTADDPTLSRDAWTLPVEAADNWTEFVRAKGKCCAAVNRGIWLGQRSASTVAPVWSSVLLVTELGSTGIPDARKKRRPRRPGRAGHRRSITQQAPLGEDRADAFPEGVGLLQVWIAGEDEVIQAQLGVLGDPISDLCV